MRRRITSRVLLSILLLWQLSAGALTHAYGMSGHDERGDVFVSASPASTMQDLTANASSMNSSSMQHAHCHEQMDAGADTDMDTMAMDMDSADEMATHEMIDMPDSSTTMPAKADAHERQATHHSDCCQSLLCKCPCAHAVALILPWPYLPSFKPSSLIIIADVTPMARVGLSGQFRPPI